MRLFDNGLRHEGKMSASLLNNDIELGIELDLETLEIEIPHRTKERKDIFHIMMRKWNNMELKIYSIRREEQRLATWSRN